MQGKAEIALPPEVAYGGFSNTGKGWLFLNACAHSRKEMLADKVMLNPRLRNTFFCETNALIFPASVRIQWSFSVHSALLPSREAWQGVISQWGLGQTLTGFSQPKSLTVKIMKCAGVGITFKICSQLLFFSHNGNRGGDHRFNSTYFSHCEEWPSGRVIREWMSEWSLWPYRTPYTEAQKKSFRYIAYYETLGEKQTIIPTEINLMAIKRLLVH